ncbi:MAG: alpha/beta hydrolase [Bacteroidetes bacterium]|nr:alpha/beta hydrolase [Bacteroidota bacterium]
MRTEIQLDDKVLEVFIYGNGSKKMLIFHGFDNEATEFEPLSTFLPEYTLISVNLFFHGNSTASEKSVQLGLSHAGFIKLHQVLMDKFPAEKYDVMGFSLGGRIALMFFQLFTDKVDRLILLAPDGLKPTTMYRFITRNKYGNKLFRRVMKNPDRLIAFGNGLMKLKLLDEKKIRFLKYNMENELRRQKVYDAWMIYRFILPDIAAIKKIIKERSSRVDLFFGKFDVLMRPSLGTKFKNGLGENCKVHVLQTGHQLISEKNLEVIAGLLK